MTEIEPPSSPSPEIPNVDITHTIGATPLIRADLRLSNGDLDQFALLHALEPSVTRGYEAHMQNHEKFDWTTAKYMPFSRGRDYPQLGGEDWVPEDAQIGKEAITALIVNWLTEENLPSYFSEIQRKLGVNSAWVRWNRRWSAEEGRHGHGINSFLEITRAADPVVLDQLRMHQVSQGYYTDDKKPLHMLAYVSFQELATKLSHKNTGIATQDPAAKALLDKIALDENRHMVFYRSVVNDAFEFAPDHTMEAVKDEVMAFEMPGSNIQNFTRMAAIIANAGIYDTPKHKAQVVDPVLKYWNVWDRTDLSAVGEAAREELAVFLAEYDAKAKEFVERRAERRARQYQRFGRATLLVGKNALISPGE